MSVRGLTVALVGLDGVGKTTQAELLAEQVRAGGEPAAVVGSATIDRVRDVYRGRGAGPVVPGSEEHAAWLVSRSTVLAVTHAIAERVPGVYVFDRHLVCLLAANRLHGHGQEDTIRRVNQGLPSPDVTIFLDIEPEQAHERLVGRGTGLESLRTLTEYRRAYTSLQEFEGFDVVDAGRDASSVAADVAQVVAGAAARAV